MLAIPYPAYHPIGMTLPFGSSRTDEAWIGMAVIIDGTIKFQFFWLDRADRIMPIGPCMAVARSSSVESFTSRHSFVFVLITRHPTVCI